MQIPRNEYPRPQFRRDDWLCLNGEWEFEIDDGGSGEARGYPSQNVSAEQSPSRSAPKAGFPVWNIPISCVACGMREGWIFRIHGKGGA